MTEASVEDVKQIPAGREAYDKQDALTFLKTAMEVHDYVSPQISDRACQNARIRFETYRQPPNATIAEHLAEFRKRLEHCCKVRGDKVTDVYKDRTEALPLIESRPARMGRMDQHLPNIPFDADNPRWSGGRPSRGGVTQGPSQPEGALR